MSELEDYLSKKAFTIPQAAAQVGKALKGVGADPGELARLLRTGASQYALDRASGGVGAALVPGLMALTGNKNAFKSAFQGRSGAGALSKALSSPSSTAVRAVKQDWSSRQLPAQKRIVSGGDISSMGAAAAPRRSPPAVRLPGRAADTPLAYQPAAQPAAPSKKEPVLGQLFGGMGDLGKTGSDSFIHFVPPEAEEDVKANGLMTAQALAAAGRPEGARHLASYLEKMKFKPEAKAAYDKALAGKPSPTEGEKAVAAMKAVRGDSLEESGGDWVYGFTRDQASRIRGVLSRNRSKWLNGRIPYEVDVDGLQAAKLLMKAENLEARQILAKRIKANRLAGKSLLHGIEHPRVMVKGGVIPPQFLKRVELDKEGGERGLSDAEFLDKAVPMIKKDEGQGRTNIYPTDKGQVGPWGLKDIDALRRIAKSEGYNDPNAAPASIFEPYLRARTQQAKMDMGDLYKGVEMDDNQKLALTNAAYFNGKEGLSKYKEMNGAVAEGNFADAAGHLLNSKEQRSERALADKAQAAQAAKGIKAAPGSWTTRYERLADLMGGGSSASGYYWGQPAAKPAALPAPVRQQATAAPAAKPASKKPTTAEGGEAGKAPVGVKTPAPSRASIPRR